MLKRENVLKRIRGFYDCSLVKVLYGIKGCGKTTILYQIMDELRNDKSVDEEHIIFLDLGKEKFDYHSLNDYVESKIIDNKIYYVFLDDVQNVDNFERVVNSFRATRDNASVFITGSNLSLRISALTSALGARHVSFEIFPFSYEEYILFTNNDVYDLVNFRDYVKWGGLPYRCSLSNEKDIKNYLDNLIISNDTLLIRRVTKYLIANLGKDFSIDNACKYLEVSVDTLNNCLEVLCNALVIKRVTNYDLSGFRYYFTDLGFIQSSNINHAILENIVFISLINKGYRVYVGKDSNCNVSFIANCFGNCIYVNVAKSSNHVKEFSKFNLVKNDFSKYIVSLDRVTMSKNGIEYLYLIDFLFKKDY